MFGFYLNLGRLFNCRGTQGKIRTWSIM
jgi:hypothetical protein